MARDFFDELSDTITRTTKDLGKKAGQLYEAQKIRSKISSEEQMVQKLKADIGNVIFEKYKEGAEVEEALKGFCEEIEQHLDIIDGYKDAAAEMKGRKICPACGKSVDRSVSFCPYCGSVCPTPEPEKAEGDVVDTETAEPVEETEEKQAENEAGAEEERPQQKLRKVVRIFLVNKEAACMLSLTIAGGIFLLDYKIKEHIDSTRLQGSKEEVLGGRLLLRNCHNKDKILGKVKIGRENCQELAAAGMGCVAGEYWHQLLHGGNKLSRAGLAMILGGGMSNYTDRRNKGYVTDYVSLNVKKKEIRKIVFNLSDVCIAAGTILWAAGNLFSYRKK